MDTRDITAWSVLTRNLDRLVEKLQHHQPPRLRLLVDDQVVCGLVIPSERDLAAHSRWPGMPDLNLRGWLLEVLRNQERRRPNAQVVELLTYWPVSGRVELLARVRRPKRALLGSSGHWRGFWPA